MLGAQVDDWICFSMVYHAGSSLPFNFRDLQYAFLQETFACEVEHHYPCIQCFTHEFDNPVTQSAIKLHAILDSPDDQTAPGASPLFKRVIHSTQNFFVGTPNNTSDLVLVVARSECHQIMHTLLGMILPTSPSWIHQYHIHHHPQWLHRLVLAHLQGC